VLARVGEVSTLREWDVCMYVCMSEIRLVG